MDRGRGHSILTTELKDQLLNAAIRYAEMGYPVFPCVPGGKVPLTKRGFKDASTDTEQIESWWREHPNANIGVATAGLLVVDIDGEENSWLADDPEKMADLVRGPLSLTPGGGRHHLFRQPEGKVWSNTSGRLAPRVDTRANGGYIVAPPSVIGGKAYSWAETLELDAPPGQLPEPPAWLAELLDNGPSRSAEALPVTPIGAPCSPQGESLAAGGNMIPSGQRNATLARLAGTMRRVGMSADEILAALVTVNRNRCLPPLSDAEVARTAASVARYEPDQVAVAVVENHWAQDGETERPAYVSAFDLCREFTELCKPVIHGLLREGETMNVIAAPKTGKSWLVLNLALSVVTGMPWLEFPTEPGRVLIIDNELHPETLANRIPRVTQAMRLPASTWKDGLYVQTLRGRLEDLFRMEAYFQALPEGFFKLIILDAFYRFMPKGMDENDNGTMANLYNVIDRCAAHLQGGFVLIHHTTKGLQSGKAVTDVGAGAGSQSRAADCHLVLRPHEEDGCLSVDAVARSWPSPDPFVIRQDFPLWKPDPDLDPADLRKPYQKKSRKYREAETPESSDEHDWTPEMFVDRFIDTESKTKAAVLAEANLEELSDYKAGKLIEKAEALGLIHRWKMGHHRIGYATRQQPEPETEASPSKREAVEAAIRESPDRSTREIAEQCGVSKRYVNRIKKESEGGN